jgi:hypothetical protein
MANSKENKRKGRPKKNNDKEPYRNTVFCNKLNKLFGDSGESQEVAANKFNTTRQTFGNWLAGRNQPDYEKTQQNLSAVSFFLRLFFVP